MPSVVKHSYIKGKNLVARARAHINYIQYRAGDEGDRAGGARSGRELHGSRDFEYSGRELKEDIASQLGRNDVLHKIILSPGQNEVDAHAYTKDVMQSLGRAKGQELVYGYVVHDNTAHKHVHVVLLGRDEDGRKVRIDKHDHMRMRAFGDRYLEREHGIEHRLDREMELYARREGLNIMFEKEAGHDLWALLELDKRKESPDQAHREWELFDKQWKDFFDRPEKEEQPYLGKSEFHDIGRQSDLRELWKNREEQELWKGVLDNNPELKEYAAMKLGELAEQRAQLETDIAEKTQVRDPWAVIDKLSDDFAREALELDMVINPEKYEPREWDRADIDVEKLRAQDKIKLADERVITKHDDKETLLEVDRWLKEDQSHILSREEYGKLWGWIGAKEKEGDHVFGEPPLLPKSPDKAFEGEREVEVAAFGDDVDLIADAADDKGGNLLTRFSGSHLNLEEPARDEIGEAFEDIRDLENLARPEHEPVLETAAASEREDAQKPETEIDPELAEILWAGDLDDGRDLESGDDALFADQVATGLLDMGAGIGDDRESDRPPDDQDRDGGSQAE